MTVSPHRRAITGVALSAAQVVDVLDPASPTDPGEFGTLLDESGLDFVVLQSAAAPRFDPSIAATVLGRHSDSIGLVVAAAPLRDHPYNLARRLSSLDHLTGGRAGWLILPDDIAAPDGSVWTAADRVDVLTDSVEVARKLWESWPSDSIIGDHSTGVFSESQRIVHIDHKGPHRVAGPLNLPSPPQAHLPVFWESGGWPDSDPVVHAADVVIGPVAAQPGRRVVVPWRIGTPRPEPGGDGVLGFGDGTAADVVAAVAKHVAGRSPSHTRTLRERLGLPEPRPSLHGPARSAFPLS